jgi:hypothetical protein
MVMIYMRYSMVNGDGYVVIYTNHFVMVLR